MKKITFLLCVFFINLTAKAEIIEKPVILYASAQDYVTGKAMDGNAIAIIKDLGPSHLQIKYLVDSNHKKIKKGLAAWALKHEGNTYFNLGYSNDLNQVGVFAKLDIVGRYCAVIVDKDSPNGLKRSNINYGGGLAGVLQNDSFMWSKAWIDKDGKKHKILFIDTSTTSTGDGAITREGYGDFLTKSLLSDLITIYAIDLHGKEQKDLSFEDIVELIIQINKGAA